MADDDKSDGVHPEICFAGMNELQYIYYDTLVGLTLLIIFIVFDENILYSH